MSAADSLIHYFGSDITVEDGGRTILEFDSKTISIYEHNGWAVKIIGSSSDSNNRSFNHLKELLYSVSSIEDLDPETLRTLNITYQANESPSIDRTISYAQRERERERAQRERERERAQRERERERAQRERERERAQRERDRAQRERERAQRERERGRAQRERERDQAQRDREHAGVVTKYDSWEASPYGGQSSIVIGGNTHVHVVGDSHSTVITYVDGEFVKTVTSKQGVTVTKY
jgi:type IV secretory pathway VirB10-like protein